MQLETTMDSTTPEFHEYVRSLRMNDVAAWISFHEDDQHWHTSTFARARCGLYYLRTEYDGDQPGVGTLIRDARIHGRFSPRPVRLGQYFDGSMMHGAVDLLRHWCGHRQLDVIALWGRAYPDAGPKTLPDLDEVTDQSRWEGVVYPPHWTAALSRELGVALREVGYARLGILFSKLISRIP
jgi:hypothetical protein